MTIKDTGSPRKSSLFYLHKTLIFRLPVQKFPLPLPPEIYRDKFLIV